MTSAVKLQLEKVCELQKEIHHFEGSTDSDVSSFFSVEYRKVILHTKIRQRLRANRDGNTVIFTVNNNAFHYLLNTVMRQETRRIRVKDAYKDKIQICWPHNMGTASIVEAQFRVGEEIWQSWDRVWADIKSQFYMKPGFRDHYNMCIGNYPALESWTDSLVPRVLNVPQPWFYASKEVFRSFPIYLFEGQEITHRYTMLNRISEVLRMRKLTSRNGWVEIPCNISYLEGEGIKEDLLPEPQLLGDYAYISDYELELMRSCKVPEFILIDEIVKYDAPNPNGYGAKEVINLPCMLPCRAIFWVAENLKATKKRNFSNYTTDTNNLYDGWSPISKISLKFGEIPRIEDMPYDQFCQVEPMHYFSSAPTEAGYFGYSFAYNSDSIDADIDVCLGLLNASMSFHIYNTDPSIVPIETVEEEPVDSDEEPPSPRSIRSVAPTIRPDDSQFTIRCRLLATKKIKIINREGQISFIL